MRYKLRDKKTGDVTSFEWDGEEPPRLEDIEAIKGAQDFSDVQSGASSKSLPPITPFSKAESISAAPNDIWSNIKRWGSDLLEGGDIGYEALNNPPKALPQSIAAEEATIQRRNEMAKDPGRPLEPEEQASWFPTFDADLSTPEGRAEYRGIRDTAKLEALKIPSVYDVAGLAAGPLKGTKLGMLGDVANMADAGVGIKDIIEGETPQQRIMGGVRTGLGAFGGLNDLNAPERTLSEALNAPKYGPDVEQNHALFFGPPAEDFGNRALLSYHGLSGRSLKANLERGDVAAPSTGLMDPDALNPSYILDQFASDYNDPYKTLANMVPSKEMMDPEIPGGKLYDRDAMTPTFPQDYEIENHFKKFPESRQFFVDQYKKLHPDWSDAQILQELKTKPPSKLQLEQMMTEEWAPPGYGTHEIASLKDLPEIGKKLVHGPVSHGATVDIGGVKHNPQSFFEGKSQTIFPIDKFEGVTGDLPLPLRDLAEEKGMRYLGDQPDEYIPVAEKYLHQEHPKGYEPGDRVELTNGVQAEYLSNKEEGNYIRYKGKDNKWHNRIVSDDMIASVTDKPGVREPAPLDLEGEVRNWEAVLKTDKDPDSLKLARKNLEYIAGKKGEIGEKAKGVLDVYEKQNPVGPGLKKKIKLTPEQVDAHAEAKKALYDAGFDASSAKALSEFHFPPKGKALKNLEADYGKPWNDLTEYEKAAYWAGEHYNNGDIDHGQYQLALQTFKKNVKNTTPITKPPTGLDELEGFNYPVQPTMNPKEQVAIAEAKAAAANDPYWKDKKFPLGSFQDNLFFEKGDWKKAYDALTQAHKDMSSYLEPSDLGGFSDPNAGVAPKGAQAIYDEQMKLGSTHDDALQFVEDQGYDPTKLTADPGTWKEGPLKPKLSEFEVADKEYNKMISAGMSHQDIVDQLDQTGYSNKAKDYIKAKGNAKGNKGVSGGSKQDYLDWTKKISYKDYTAEMAKFDANVDKLIKEGKKPGLAEDLTFDDPSAWGSSYPGHGNPLAGGKTWEEGALKGEKIWTPENISDAELVVYQDAYKAAKAAGKSSDEASEAALDAVLDHQQNDTTGFLPNTKGFKTAQEAYDHSVAKGNESWEALDYVKDLGFNPDDVLLPSHKIAAAAQNEAKQLDPSLTKLQMVKILKEKGFTLKESGDAVNAVFPPETFKKSPLEIQLEKAIEAEKLKKADADVFTDAYISAKESGMSEKEASDFAYDILLNKNKQKVSSVNQDLEHATAAILNNDKLSLAMRAAALKQLGYTHSEAIDIIKAFKQTPGYLKTLSTSQPIVQNPSGASAGTPSQGNVAKPPVGNVQGPNKTVLPPSTAKTPGPTPGPAKGSKQTISTGKPAWMQSAGGKNPPPKVPKNPGGGGGQIPGNPGQMQGPPKPPKPSSKWAQVADIVNVPRAFMSAGDLPPILRQGLFLLSHPVRQAKAFKEGLISTFQGKKAIDFYTEVMRHPDYQKAVDAGLNIEHDAANDLIASSFAEKINPLVRMSKRGAHAYLTRLRMDVFADYKKDLKGTGVSDETIASIVNAFSGGSKLPGKLQSMSKELSTVFYSPQMQASHVAKLGYTLKALTPWKMAQMPISLRLKVLREVGTTVGAIASALYMADSLGVLDLEKDSRSSDFMKIKDGNKRLDPWGGLQQWVVFLSRIGTGEYKSGTGRVSNLGSGRGRGHTPNAIELGGRLLRQKLAPFPGMAIDRLDKDADHPEGQDMMGRKPDPAYYTEKLYPLAYRDIKDLAADKDPAMKGILSILLLSGMGGYKIDSKAEKRIERPWYDPLPFSKELGDLEDFR